MKLVYPQGMRFPILVFEHNLRPTSPMQHAYSWVAICTTPLPTIQSPTWGFGYSGVSLNMATTIYAEGRTREEAIENLQRRVQETLTAVGTKSVELTEIEV